MRRIFTLACCATLASAQTQKVLELARNAPPEFFANAVIQLVERGEIPSADQRRDLLKEAFQAAKNAREPVRLTLTPLDASNTRFAMRDAAGRLGLDALSLQSRVLKLMATTDAAAGRDRARELFPSVEHPALDARPCADPMIANVSAYSEAAGLVAGGQARTLMLAVAPANSPGELASFAKVLGADRSLPPEGFRLLVGALALKMEMAAPDYRSFTMTADDLRAGLEAIAARAREQGELRAEGVETLAEGVRKLVLAQMSSPRCEEEFGGAMRFVEWFNQARLSQDFRGALPVIEDEELVPLKTLGRFKPDRYFESAEGKQITADFGRLRMALSTAGGKPEWRDTLTEFLREFSAWKAAGANIDAFHQKMTVLHGLYQLIPPGEDLDALIARAVEFLRSSGIEREYPAEWLLQVRGLAESPMGDRTRLLAAFRDSGDAGLALYAALQR